MKETTDIQTQLRENFKGALEFLRKTQVSDTSGDQTDSTHSSGLKTRLVDRPWTIVIGPSGAGKTALFANGQLPYVLSKNVKVGLTKAIHKTRLCNWWVTARAVIVDMAGELCVNPSDPQVAQDQWQFFCRQLRHGLFHRRPHQVLVVFGLKQLLESSDEHRHTLIEQIKERLDALNKTFQQTLPVTVIVNGWDTLQGFRESFAELSEEDRGQVWGMSFINHTAQEESDRFEQFNNEFDALVKRVSDDVISALHREHNHTRQMLIQQFPQQMIGVKNRLQDVFSQLFSQASYRYGRPWCGVYFTSALQKGESVQGLLPPGHQVMDTQMPAPPSGYSASDEDETFFLRDLFNHHLFASKQVDDRRRGFRMWSRTARLSTIALVVMFVAGLGWFWTHNFQKQVERLGKAEQALGAYGVYEKNLGEGNESTLESTVKALNALEEAQALFTEPALTTHPIRWLALGYFDQKTLHEKAKTTYRRAVNRWLMPQVMAKTAEELKAAVEANHPQDVYKTLRLYLLFGQGKRGSDFLPEHLSAISKTLESDWHTPGLARHMLVGLKETKPGLILNKALVRQARIQLWRLPSEELGVLLLSHLPQWQEWSKTPLFEKGSPWVSTSPSTLPPVFTYPGFKQVVLPQLSKVVKTLQEGDPILGQGYQGFSDSDSSTKKMQSLRHRVIQGYFKSYGDAWANAIAQITLKPFSDFSQALRVISEFSKPQGLFTRLLAKVKNNTALTRFAPLAQSEDDILTEANGLSRRFEFVDQMLTYQGGVESLSSGLQSALLKLKLQVSELAKATQSDFMLNPTTTLQGNEQAFLLAKAHINRVEHSEVAKVGDSGARVEDPLLILHQQIRRLPKPVQGWMEGVARNTWQLMLHSSARFIESQWEAQVVPQYKNTIMGGYPIDGKSSRDISKQSFDQFFGRPGLLQGFFQTYLQPFVDMDQEPWAPKSVEGRELPFKGGVLRSLELGRVIQEMFYPCGVNNADLSFVLKPLGLSPSVLSMAVEQDDQTAVFSQGQKAPQKIHWTIKPNSGDVRLLFNRAQGGVGVEIEQGPWAWLKVFDHGLVQTTHDPKRYRVTFDLDGNSGRFELYAKRGVNPFVPHVISAFRLPETLI